jgi:type IX secretion system PorP/SprF family membrane protein
LTNAQQFPHFSNFLSTGNINNSCYSRIINQNEISIGYRTQWVGFDNSPKTTIGQYSHKFNEKHSGGVNFISDKVGLLNHNYFSINYAYSVKLKEESILSFGINPSFELSNLDGNQLVIINQVDNSINNSASLKSQLFDLSATIQFNDNSFYAYATVINLLGSGEEPNTSLTNSNLNISHKRHYLVSAGYFFQKSDFALLPMLMLKYSEFSPFQIQGNLKLKYKEIGWLTLGYRSNDAFVVGFGFGYKESLRIDYAFDITTSRLRNYNSGTHEFILRYLLKSKSETHSARFF